MNEDLAKDYFRKSGFDAMQADAPSKLLAETATKDDVWDLERTLAQKLDGVETRLRAEIVRATVEVRSELKQSIAKTRTELSEPISQMRADRSERISHMRADPIRAIADAQTQMRLLGIAMIIIMSFVFVLLEIFID